MDDFPSLPTPSVPPPSIAAGGTSRRGFSYDADGKIINGDGIGFMMVKVVDERSKGGGAKKKKLKHELRELAFKKG
jgi:hypothetical protein